MSDLASNLDKLAGFLEKHRASGITNLINGEARPAATMAGVAWLCRPEWKVEIEAEAIIEG